MDECINVMKIIGLTQKNLVPLVDALRENADDDSYMLGIEPDAPACAAYYHVMPNKKKGEVKESFSNGPEWSELINRAIKFHENPYARWAVVCKSEPFLVPKYFEKKSAALHYKRWGRHSGGDFRIVDLENKRVIRENISPYMQITEDKYDNLFDIRNLGATLADYKEALVYYKDIYNQIQQKEEKICDKYGCKRIFFVAGVNQGVIQVDQNDFHEFEKLCDEANEISDKIKKLEGRIQQREMWDKQEKERKERERIQKQENEENEHIISLAVDEFGLTRDLNQAGYILPDGTLLNFGSGGYRGTDHRNIADIYAENGIKIWDDEYRYNYVVDFMNRGAIRCDVNSGLLDMTKEPTNEQYYVINSFVRQAGDVDIDFTDNKGDIIHSVSYSNANPQAVVADIQRFYNEGIMPQGNVRYEGKRMRSVMISENQLRTIKENFAFEVNSSEVDLSSFKKKDTLQPSIWKDGDTLNSKIRLKLLDIADDFWEYVNLSWVEPKGIILTGSICNFNWSRFSDIDLHLIVDFKEIDEKTDFVREYLDMKKNDWNNEHNALRIMDFNVELYVQDTNDDIDSGGIYDLEENKWIKKPEENAIKPIGLNKFKIKDKAAEIMTIIDDMFDALNATDDMHEAETIGNDAKYLWSKIKELRKDSLGKDGEMGPGNIIYKCLRRTGYLDKLWKLRTAVYDKTNSINESLLRHNEVKNICKNESIKRYLTLLKEEVVADGSAEHNPYKKKWDLERKALKDFLDNYGKIMTSRENGKQYKCYFDNMLSSLIGFNYCICIQWDPIKMEVGATPYIRALDKFTDRLFQAQFDDRGKDNERGTSDDIGNSYQPNN